jgi:hypothetical protein
MKKIITLVVLATFIMVGVSSCKKYEEGPAISFRSKTSRVAGDWTLDKATQDGVDITSTIQIDYITFEKEGAYKFVGGGMEVTGTWSFDDKKENIIIKEEGSADQQKFKIIKLKNKVLWFDQEVGTQILRYQWVPK